MNDAESLLVITSFIFSTVSYVLVLTKGHALWPFTKGVFFNKKKMSSYTLFLLAVFLCSLFLGYIIARDGIIVLEYVGLNLLIGAIMGCSLFLIEKKPESK